MDGSMIRHTFLTASALAGACVVAACGGASAAAHPPSTASPAAAAVDGCCAQYSPGQPSACDPERRGPGPDAAAQASGHASPGCGPQTAPA